MSGLAGKKAIFTMGATNRPDILNSAIMRPVRLGELHYIQLAQMFTNSSKDDNIISKHFFQIFQFAQKGFPCKPTF
jgi:ATP-dependent Zn protease